MRIVRRIYRLIQVTLQVGLVGVVVLAAGVYGAGKLGYISPIRPYVVLSGSMEPAIPTGSVVLSQA